MIGISSLAILDKKGKSLLTRNYRKEQFGSLLDAFNQKLLEYDAENQPPILTINDHVFFHIRHENLKIVALTVNDSNAAMVFAFLEAFKNLL